MALAATTPVFAADDVLQQADTLLRQQQAAQAYDLLAPLEDERAGDPKYDYLLGVALLALTGLPVAWATIRGMFRGHFASDIVATLAILTAIALQQPIAAIALVLIALLAYLLLFEQRDRVDDHAVADHTGDVLMEDAARYEV